MARKYNYYQGYSGGGPSALPPGFMEAATSGARSIARGIESASKSISDAIKEKDEEEKQLNKLSKAAATGMEALDKLLPEMNVYGEGGKEAFNNLSAMEKIGMFQGAEKAQEMANKKIAARYQQTMTNQMTYKQDVDRDTTAGSRQVMDLMSKPSQRDIANELGLGVFADSFPMEDREQKLLNAMGQALENYPQADPNAMSQAVERLLSQQKTTGTAVPGTVRDVPGMPNYMFGISSTSGAGSFIPVPGKQAGSEGYEMVDIEGSDSQVVRDKVTGDVLPSSKVISQSDHPVDKLGATQMKQASSIAVRYWKTLQRKKDIEKEMEENDKTETDAQKYFGDSYGTILDELDERLSSLSQQLGAFNTTIEDFTKTGVPIRPQGGANARSNISSADFFNDPRNADRHNPNR